MCSIIKANSPQEGGIWFLRGGRFAASLFEQKLRVLLDALLGIFEKRAQWD